MTRQDELGARRRLRSAVERLPRAVPPARDLWPGIAARLHERRRPGAGWWRLAAAVALVAAGLLAALALRPEAPAARSAIAAAAAEPTAALSAARSRQRDGVLHLHGDLMAAAARRRGRLDEAGARALDAGLAELGRAADEIEAALEASPHSRRLRLALAAAYRRESGWTSRLGRV